MNIARSHGKASAQQLQRWFVESDVATDPQAFIISPNSAVKLAEAIVSSRPHYHAGVAVARTAVDLLRSAHAKRNLRIEPNEIIWFDNMQDELDELPESESKFIDQQLAKADTSRFLPQEYELTMATKF